MKRFAASLLLLVFASPAPGQISLTEGTNFSIDAAADGRLVIDLLGALWIVPPGGGVAEALRAGDLPGRRPRWSPAADAIVFASASDGNEQLWLYRFGEDAAKRISDGGFTDLQPSWHPDGQRIVYASARRDSGFDLWELDLATKLTWRLTHSAGDELEPAWSANGRDLVYVHRETNQWSLTLRRHGEPDRVLLTSPSRLSAPQWRPDGSLITFLRHGEDTMSIDMVILSDPLLIRPLLAGEDFFVSPLAWLDRENFVYPANGVIRKRNFNSWSSSIVPFRVTVGATASTVPAVPRIRELPRVDLPAGRLIIRTARLFDGIGGGYRSNLDIVVEDGLIKALQPQREHPGEIVIDLGNLTTLPGFIDSYAALPETVEDRLGPLLLSLGVTTLVTERADAARLNALWSGKSLPGPRVLAAAAIGDGSQPDDPWLLTVGGDLAAGIGNRDAVSRSLAAGTAVLALNWQVALGSGATMLLGADSLPRSPGGQRYADIELANGHSPITIVSGLADRHTPGLQALLQSRQAALLDVPSGLRRLAEPPALPSTAPAIVLGSKPNGLPPGIALHAEFRALAAAGVNGEQLLRAAGVNAAAALGMGLAAGRLAPGSVADLVIVDGDPLANVADLQKVVAVVRNGRFFSAIGLIERAATSDTVE